MISKRQHSELSILQFSRLLHQHCLQVAFNWLNGQNKPDMDDYIISGTWDVVDGPGHIEKWGKNPSHTQIVYKIVIRRKTLFYTVNLILPCIIITFLTICVFHLPSMAMEKITLSISNLLALTVFLLLVSKILPPTSEIIPLVARYLLFTLFLNVVTIAVTVCIINYNFRCSRTHDMPSWVSRAFLDILPRLLFMTRPDHKERAKRPDAAEVSTNASQCDLYRSAPEQVGSYRAPRHRKRARRFTECRNK